MTAVGSGAFARASQQLLRCAVLPDCYAPTDYVCQYNEGPDHTFYIPDIEYFTLRIDHSMDVPAFDLSESAVQMNSLGMFGADGKQVDLCARASASAAAALCCAVPCRVVPCRAVLHVSRPHSQHTHPDNVHTSSGPPNSATSLPSNRCCKQPAWKAALLTLC